MTSLNSKLQLSLLNRKKGRNLLEKGFTLVELMIVIVIVGILSAVALPNFLGQQDKAKATEATSQMTAILKDAYAEYLYNNSAADALTEATASANRQTSNLFSYAPAAGAAGTSGVGTIEVTATVVSGGPAINPIKSCINLTSGKTDTGRPGKSVSC